MNELKKIDINADLGESYASDQSYIDDLLMPLLSSCNIATGGHFGNEKTMVATCKLARRHNVNIGAHLSYVDKENFGRLSLDVSIADLKKQWTKQMDLFEKITKSLGISIHHIKPHGALYHDVCSKPELGTAFCSFIVDRQFDGIIYGLSGSCIAEIAKSFGIRFWSEIFADRAYTVEGKLQSRSNEGSVLSNASAVTNQLNHWIINKTMPVKRSMSKSLSAETICVHSDTRDALNILKVTKDTFEANGYHIL